MTGRSFISAAAMLLLLMSTGCGRWWCEHCCGTPVAGCAPVAPACGCAPGYYQPPVAVQAQSPSWSQPRPLTGCTCTCPQP